VQDKIYTSDVRFVSEVITSWAYSYSVENKQYDF